jgi:two-component system, LytTR family, sensor kinase
MLETVYNPATERVEGGGEMGVTNGTDGSWRRALYLVLAWEGAGLVGTLLVAAPVANFHHFLHLLGTGAVFTNVVGLSGLGLTWLDRRVLRPAAWRAGSRVALLACGLLLSAGAAAALALWSGRWICDLDGNFVDRLHLLLISVNAVVLVCSALISGLLLAHDRLARDLEHRVRENERLERLRVEAQLAALQAKVNPHFLFNTLNTMIDMVHDQPEKVERMILGLSEIYRRVLTLPETDTLSLAEELRLVDEYLSIEAIRMGPRLAWSIDVPEAALDARVPPLAVEVLVENAVQHGLAPRRSGGRLWVTAQQQGHAVVVEVADDGVGVRAQAQTGGFGLRSIRERMALLQREGAHLRIEPRVGGGTRALLELPREA